MRVLFATGSAAAYMAPPRLSDEQVICGPDWPDSRDADGRWLSLSTPVGQYDLSEVAARLPAEQQPDVVVCLVDASRRNVPRRLGAFKCPRVLLIADTHHLHSPILGMLGYLASEPYTRNVILYDRHHAGVFRSAGVRNLFWFPGLTFPHGDEVVRAARQTRRVARIAFVGQAGPFHPRRLRLLTAMRQRGISVVQQPLPQAEALKFYGKSTVGFNASLNGDLNLRIFEILAAGAALVTDRLAESSGLTDLFREGQELVCYGSAAELNEVATRLLAAPTETESMALAGAAWFDARFSQRYRREGFQALAFDGRPFPGCDLPSSSSRVYFPGDMPQLLKTVAIYEGLQELHRTQESVAVEIGEGVPGDVAALCATLPRIETRQTGARGVVDMAIVGRDAPEGSVPADAKNVWCAFPRDQRAPAFASSMAATGWGCVNEKLGLFRRAPRAGSAAPRATPSPSLVFAS